MEASGMPNIMKVIKRKSEKKKRIPMSWSKEQLCMAFKLVEEGKSMRVAARYTGVPLSTLQERIKHKNSQIPSLGRNPVFTKEQEAEIYAQAENLENLKNGCSTIQIRKLAYEYAEKNGIKHNFSRNRQLAGKEWLAGFMKRKYNISMKKSESSSRDAATPVFKNIVSLFFYQLEELMRKNKFLPKNIFNVDVTVVCPVTEKNYIGSECTESGRTDMAITAVCAVSATGAYLPPMLIYPRKTHSPELEKDGPPAAVYRCSKNGCLTEFLFLDWLKHFTAFNQQSANEPILLILDNHKSYFSLRYNDFCKRNNIVMLSTPPDEFHRLQPLKVSFYGPLKTAYDHECNHLMDIDLRRRVTQNDVASLFWKAFQKVATIPIAETGFAATGIYPLNPNVFSKDDIMNTDIPNNSELVVSRGEKGDRCNDGDVVDVEDQCLDHDYGQNDPMFRDGCVMYNSIGKPLSYSINRGDGDELILYHNSDEKSISELEQKDQDMETYKFFVVEASQSTPTHETTMEEFTKESPELSAFEQPIEIQESKASLFEHPIEVQESRESLILPAFEQPSTVQEPTESPKLSAFEQSIVNVLQATVDMKKEEEDADLYFLKSLLPNMKSLTESQKLDFKLGVLQLYKSIARDNNDHNSEKEPQHIKEEVVQFDIEPELP